MNHVNNGFKGYQYYEFNYIKDLAAPSKELAKQDDKDSKQKKTDIASFPGQNEKEKKDDLFFFESEYKAEENLGSKGSMHNLLDLGSEDTNLLNIENPAP